LSGQAEGQNIFRGDMYGQLSVHYDSAGRMDAWMVSDWGTDQIPLVQSAKGIVLNHSEFLVVLRLYGTAGFNLLDATVEYLYEDVEGKLIYRPTIRDVV
jgi:hypothetical protein